MKIRRTPLPLCLLTVLALCILAGRAAAADFQSNSITAGGASVVFSRSATDTNGNIYVTGFYQNTFSYGGLSAPVLPAGITNFFLLKTDAAGNALWLTSSISSTMPFVQGTAIAVDTAGNVYIGIQLTNSTSSSAGINFSTSVGFTFPASATVSILAKYMQSSGTFVYARVDPTITSVIRGLAVSADNSSVIAMGNFRGSGSFNGTTLTSFPSGADNIFLVKINASSGATTWATDATCATGGYDDGAAMALDSSGNIYTIGTFGGTMFSGKPYQLTAYSTNPTNSSAFVVKWTNSTPTTVPFPQWALASTDTSNSFTSGTGLAVDVSSNVYVSFSLARTDPNSTNVLGLNIYGTNNGTHYSQTNGGSEEGSIVKFDSNGNILWGEGTHGDPGTINYNTKIVVSTNYVYALGFYGGNNGNVVFDGTTTLSSVNGDYFLMQLKTNGTLGWVKAMNASGATPQLAPTDLAVSPNDVLNVVGDTEETPTNGFIAQITVPVASVMTVTRTAGLSLKIALADVATNWSDGSGLTISLAGINLVTTNGVNLTTNSAYIFYTNSPNVNDQIIYTIADSAGGTGMGIINIVIVGSVSGQTTGVTVSGNSATVGFAGIPNYTYNVQRSTNLVVGVGWVTIWTTNAPPGGLFNYTDQFSDLGGTPPSSAYYRLSWSP